MIKLCGFACQTVVVFVLTLRVSRGVEKFWLPNVEWQTATNWVNGRVPEIDSHVVFPLQMRHAAGIAKSTDLRLSEVALPRSGSLVLTQNGKLELSELTTPGQKISEWSRAGHLFWADPGNWNGTSIATPHLERVPCRRDDIVLPESDRTLSIFLPMRNVRVRSIRTADQKHPFTRYYWEDFEGREEFARGRFTVTYADYTCDKCPCQDDSNSDYFEEVCAIERPKCGFTGCEYPLTVEGHCCQYCGGRISLSSKASLSLVGTLAAEALEGYTDKVSWHVRRTWGGQAEVLLKENAEYSGIDIQEAVENVRKKLVDTGIEVLDVETAGAALQDSRLAVALGPLLGAPLIIVVLLLLGFSYFGYSLGQVATSCAEAFSSVREGIRADKQQSQKPFSFARFENVPEGATVQIAEVASGSEQTVQTDKDAGKSSSSGGRFENPLYRSKRRREDEKQILDAETSISLATLADKADDHIEEVEMNINE